MVQRSHLLLLLSIAFTASFAESSFESRKALARQLLEQRDYRAALDVAQSVHREWKDDLPAYQLMAEAHLGLGDYDDAERDIQWMLDLREGKADARGWWLVAQFREATGDTEGALEAVSIAIGRISPAPDPDAPKILAFAGHLYAAMHRLDAAGKLATSALAASPEEPEALLLIARVRAEEGRRGEAIRILRQLARASDEPRYLYVLAELTGDYRAFESSARACTGSARNANRELALYLAGRGGRPAEALAIARRESLRRHDAGTLDALAVALAANGRPAEARATMAKVLAVGTRQPEILLHAARLGVKPQ